MNTNKNYALRMWGLLVLTFIGVSMLYYLPETIGGWELKPIDMLSELRRDSLNDLNAILSKETEQLSSRDNATNADHQASLSQSKQQKAYEKSIAQMGVGQDSSFIAIDNYDALARFYHRLKQKEHLERPVRIAVLGDSFIEGDIFTAPLRTLLQDKYGGGGLGWLPMSSTIAGFRTSLRHDFSGWTDKSVLSSAQDAQTFTGHYYIPKDAAWSRYSVASDTKPFTEAVLYYTLSDEGKISLSSNQNEAILERTLTPSNLIARERIVLPTEQSSIKLNIHSPNGLRIYGLALENTNGVSVDNMSLRGASGSNLLSIDDDLSQSFCEARPYDLIILQYGLNVANRKQTNYNFYAKTLRAMINKLRRVAPEADILVMSVSDRASKTGQGLTTMKEIFYLHEVQQEISREQGCAFWSMLHAMHSIGGIAQMANRGEAAKDYTHLSHKGGAVVAKQFMKAILLGEIYHETLN